MPVTATRARAGRRATCTLQVIVDSMTGETLASAKTGAGDTICISSCDCGTTDAGNSEVPDLPGTAQQR